MEIEGIINLPKFDLNHFTIGCAVAFTLVEDKYCYRYGLIIDISEFRLLINYINSSLVIDSCFVLAKNVVSGDQKIKKLVAEWE